jgi:hypothetical protein
LAGIVAYFSFDQQIDQYGTETNNVRGSFVLAMFLLFGFISCSTWLIFNLYHRIIFTDRNELIYVTFFGFRRLSPIEPRYVKSIGLGRGAYNGLFIYIIYEGDQGRRVYVSKLARLLQLSPLSGNYDKQPIPEYPEKHRLILFWVYWLMDPQLKADFKAFRDAIPENSYINPSINDINY